MGSDFDVHTWAKFKEGGLRILFDLLYTCTEGSSLLEMYAYDLIVTIKVLDFLLQMHWIKENACCARALITFQNVYLSSCTWFQG